VKKMQWFRDNYRRSKVRIEDTRKRRLSWKIFKTIKIAIITPMFKKINKQRVVKILSTQMEVLVVEEQIKISIKIKKQIQIINHLSSPNLSITKT